MATKTYQSAQNTSEVPASTMMNLPTESSTSTPRAPTLAET